MLFSYNADLLPQVRMMGQIRYSEPWLHFSRCINEWVLYVIRDGNLYLQEDGVRYHLAAGDFFLLEPGGRACLSGGALWICSQRRGSDCG